MNPHLPQGGGAAVEFSTQSPCAVQAVTQLRHALDRPGLQMVLFFASLSSYEPEPLQQALNDAFDVPVIGCTSAGQVGHAGFQAGGLTAVGFFGSGWFFKPHLITSLSVEGQPIEASIAAMERDVDAIPEGMKPFGLVLVDGLSMQEERLMAHLYRSLIQMPIVGGSAGDDLNFEQTLVFCDGAFHRDAALFVLCATDKVFATVRAQHHQPTSTKLVVTEADPSARIIHEINGLPAADAYSQAIGVPVAEFCPEVYSLYPVMIRVGDAHYIRSIQRCNPDKSLTFYCAIERGLVLSVGHRADALEALSLAFERVQEQIQGRPELIIGFDCILRRLEFEARGLNGAIVEQFVNHNVVGFYTYGEQINGLHVNQTFTGIAFGA